jgi:putative methyltransferase
VIAREELFERFAAFLATRPEHPLARFVERSVAELSNYEFQNSGLVAHLALHEHREAVDVLLKDFIDACGWGDDEAVAAVFELDLLCRPYIYAEAPRRPGCALSRFDVEVDADADLLHAELRAGAVALPSGDGTVLRAGDRLSIRHSRARKLPFFGGAASVHSASYCQGMMLRMRELMPVLTPDARAVAAEGAA